jgi:hypothetical protein
MKCYPSYSCDLDRLKNLMHKIEKIVKNMRLTKMNDADIPSLSKINPRAPNKLNIPAKNKVSLIFFSILFVFENSGIIKNSAEPQKTVTAIKVTEVLKSSRNE